jgi:N-acetylmuramoyl-L-alanine amidase
VTRYLTDLADVLRGAGLSVVEVIGWETRGRSGNSPYQDGRPWCVMWHHTASAGDGEWDADYCTFGSPDAPLTNLVIGRDGIVYVCAAGPTNTNGKGQSLGFSSGTVPADSMNTYALGVEISGDGVGMAYPAVQIDACFAVSLAVSEAYGLAPDDAAGHVDYAVGRKIDPATADAVQGGWRPDSVNSSGSWELADLRAELRARAAGTLPPPTPTPEPDPPEEEDMKPLIVHAVGGSWVVPPLLDGPPRLIVDTESLVSMIDSGAYAVVVFTDAQFGLLPQA